MLSTPTASTRKGMTCEPKQLNIHWQHQRYRRAQYATWATQDLISW